MQGFFEKALDRGRLDFLLKPLLFSRLLDRGVLDCFLRPLYFSKQLDRGRLDFLLNPVEVYTVRPLLFFGQRDRRLLDFLLNPIEVYTVTSFTGKRARPPRSRRLGELLLFADGGVGQAWLGKNLEFLRSARPQEGKSTAFVCENFVCQLPVTERSELRPLLSR